MSKEQGKKDLVVAALKECRPLFLGALLFSLVINLLTLAVPIYSMQVLDRVLSSGSINTLLMLTLIVTAATIFGGLLTGLRAVVFTQISRWLDDRIASNLVEKTLSLALLRPNIGAQPLRDLATIRGFISSPTLASIFDAPWAILFFVVLYIINVTIGVVVTIAALVLLVLAILTQRVPSKLVAAASDKQVHAMQSLDSVIRNAEVVRAMGMTHSATGIWRGANASALEDGYRAGNIGTVIGNTSKTFRMGLQIIVTGLGAYLAVKGVISMGAIIAINILTGKALAPFDAAVAIYQGWTSTRKAHKRLQPIFEFSDAAYANLELPPPVGALTVNSVSYQEPTSGRLILKGVTLNFPVGSSTGIIGPSGSGKTTLSRLVVGVKAASSGSVCLDGASLDQWRPDQLAAAIGYLPQDVELFTGTVAQNIARMAENFEDLDVVEAARAAEVHEFILSLGDGYQTEVGTNGAALSAGQRQRIALARCFYGDPKILVLDEPNSNLDTDGDQALARALQNAKARKITTLIVSHRPPLLTHVDNIAVLNQGQLVEFGNARTVLEKSIQKNKSVQPLRPKPEVAANS